MAIGVIGTKRGMTRVFKEDGRSVPVTVVEVQPNRVTQIKTEASDGYHAVQVTTGERKAQRVNRALQGHFSKAGTLPGRGLWEFRASGEELTDLAPGDEWGVDRFEEGQRVKVTGVSKGKGFAGTIKRWNFKSQDATHGNSLAHRAAGSIGQCQTPGRVFKGKKMAGHMGDAQVTVKNLTIVRIDTEHSLLMIHGAVPGATSGDLIVCGQ